MQLGPVRFAVNPRAHGGMAGFQRRLRVRETGFGLPPTDAAPPIQGLYALLAADEPRNHQILDDVAALLAEGRSPLVLTERTAHLEYLSARLRERGHRVVTLRGGQSRKHRAARVAELQVDPHVLPQVVVATGRYIGEGFDCAHLDTLLLALPISGKGTLQQYAGRLHRQHPGKTEVRIIDYVDAEVPMLRRMFERRLRGYWAMGYQRTDSAGS
jgi:superfamily II DNA or RNA helicase